MKTAKKQYIIPVFIPHLGCPNDCSFCNQKSISGKTKMPTKEEVTKIIEDNLKNIREEDSHKEIAFFGGSFTGIEVDKQKEYLEIASKYVKSKKIDSIRISTRPDYITKDILKMLKKYYVKTIELGVQSTNDYILKRCDRGHTFEDVKKASKLIKRYKFLLGHQIMVGLPESTKLDEIRTAKDLIKLRPNMVRIYPVLVIKGTKLEKEFEIGEYKPLTVSQAVERCKELLYLFNKKKIQVIRVGLQNTDEITDPKSKESSVVAGPYHPAFGQLVDDSIWYDSIVDKIKKINMKVKEVKVKVNFADMNNVIGHKRGNIKKIKETYDVDVVVEADHNIKEGKSELVIIQTYDEYMEQVREKLDLKG